MTARDVLRTLLAVAVIAGSAFLLAPSVASLGGPKHHGPLTDPIDFIAFYCGGKVLAAGADPYRYEPLHTCEARALAESQLTILRYVAVPAPLPPYALAFFSAFSFVPFRAAAACFLLVSLGCIGAAIVQCRRLTTLSLPVVGALLALALIVGSIFIGQLVPLVAASLCASAVALRAGRFGASAGFALFTLLEPHVGLAVLLGLFVLAPRTRVPLGIGAGALALLSLAAGGPALNVEYLTRVIPAHAAAEAGNFHAQYSLTAALRELGVGSDAALRLGEASYAVMLAVGLVLAGRLRAAFGDDAFAVVTPPACVLVGGVFVHDHQMALALPFAFVLARYVARRPALVVALFCLAVPWQSVYETSLGSVFPAHARFDPSPALARAAVPSALAERVWEVWVRTLDYRDGRTPWEILLFKLPTWLAFAFFGVAAVRALRESRAHPARAGLRLAGQPSAPPPDLRSATRR